MIFDKEKLLSPAKCCLGYGVPWWCTEIKCYHEKNTTDAIQQKISENGHEILPSLSLYLSYMNIWQYAQNS